MKNPCLGCHLLNEDKNKPECMKCKKRIDYVQQMNDQPWASESILKRKIKMAPNTQKDNTVPKTAASPSILPIPEIPPKHSKKNTCRTCSVDGCNGKHLAKGLCYKHYHEKRNADKTKEIKNATKAIQEAIKENGSLFEISTELLDKIEKIAEAEFRSVESQVKYMLMKSCKNYEKMMEVKL